MIVPSTSVSFAVTAIVTGVLLGVVAVSLTATGASLTAVTTNVIFALSHRAPASHNVYGIEAVPL